MAATSRLSAILLLVLVLILSTVGTVSAAGDEPPPDQAWAEPAATATPATGTGRAYWASDACHYYESGGVWRSDMCARNLVGQDTRIWSWFQNLGDGNMGRELIRYDLTDPTYYKIGLINGSGLYGWARFARTNPAKVQYLAKQQDGSDIWVEQLPNRPGGTYGPPASANPNASVLMGELARDAANASNWTKDFGRFCVYTPPC